MPFEDSKYDIDEETRNLPSTVCYFPTLADLDTHSSDDAIEDSNESVLKKISLLQIKLEQLQYSRDSKNMGGLNWSFNKFSGHILYELANEVFGFNGWSTSIEECVMSDVNVVNDEGVPATGHLSNEAAPISSNVSATTLSSTPTAPNSEETKQRYSAKCICVVRLTLSDGTCTDGVGEGSASNIPHKYMCYSKCKKEAVTDGMKNAIIGLRDLYFRYESKKASEELGIDDPSSQN
ncbi:RAD59 [Candida theae]|uniref:DNA repair and recombination protein RAD52 n=1 Tax=Candida theae TaxID=1198502 RepID=A0AAD5BFK7_9ASCO|nr:RAD59 [Candida theae]KAI5959329.1 RAD59 [Candida theae]